MFLRKLNFWIYLWFVNNKNASVAQVWGGTSLKLTFTRCVDEVLIAEWFDLLNFVKLVALTSHSDTPIWLLEPTGSYFVRSLYKMINFGGISSELRDSIWKIKVPPNIHVFLWLVINNKTLTRDNLAKRRHVDDLTWVFFTELESIQHLFFDWIVAKKHLECDCWYSQYLNSLFFYLSFFWKQRKHYEVFNIFTDATLWCLWRFRNDIVFKGRR